MALLEAVADTIDTDVGADAAALNRRYGDLEALGVISMAVNELFCDSVALVSSFGAESAVLLHLAAEVDRNIPVIFLDTGWIFVETLEYRTALTKRLGLTDVRTITPDPDRLTSDDPHRALWMKNPDLCCHIRKTEPLARALAGFDAWISGRKRFQSKVRSNLATFEEDGARIKINPIAGWSAEDLKTYAARHDLPQHPLVAKGYPSIGCVPCTSSVRPGEDQRAGRWRGSEKTECGIHLGGEADGSGI